jgi:uncharacterized cofD-like protein
VPIDYVYLDPRASVNPAAERAILDADAIVIGPGDLYTSLVANLVVEGLAEAIAASGAVRIFVCNLATKRGESDGFSASDFLRVVLDYLGNNDALDVILVNSTQPAPRVRARYASEGSHIVELDLENCERLVPHVVARPLASAGVYLRHDPELLANGVLSAIELGRSEANASTDRARGSVVQMRATLENDGRNGSTSRRRAGQRSSVHKP